MKGFSGRTFGPMTAAACPSWICIFCFSSLHFPDHEDTCNRQFRPFGEAFDDANIKANEFLFRRVELEDVVSAHLAAAERAPLLKFGKYIVSATSPFRAEDLAGLNSHAPEVVANRVPEFVGIYNNPGWKMFDMSKHSKMDPTLSRTLVPYS
jgi:UDP-glucose 4-epimerase